MSRPCVTVVVPGNWSLVLALMDRSGGIASPMTCSRPRPRRPLTCPDVFPHPLLGCSPDILSVPYDALCERELVPRSDTSYITSCRQK
ncbi:hypothetical protein BD310DRAFT_911476 [Dichomitus squalens]|uniref:Secreted protein n=1 Tax=Dichomitus squalens TaxID=114155 RepID=A0A4Q9QDT4_9APHY|nr:hypothetical protein BD310DRAFT_911476 [Dichomitus squalens]